MKNRLLTIFIFILCINSFSDVLFMNNGEEKEGNVYKINNKETVFQNDEKQITYKNEDLMRIEFPKYRDIKGENKVSDIKDSLIKDAIKNAPDASEYPEYSYATLLELTEYYIDKNFNVRKTERNIIKIFKEKAKDEGTVQKQFMKSFYRKADLLFGRTINGDKISYVDDFSIKTSSMFPYYPEYDDLTQIIASMPKVETSSIVDYSMLYESADLEIEEGLYGREYFTYFEPCMKKIVRITFPENYENRFFITNNPDITVNKKKYNGKVYVEIKKENILPEKIEDRMPPYDEYAKKINWGIKNITLEEQLKKLNAIIKDSHKNSEDIKKVTLSLIKGIKDNDKKIEAIFKYLSREIKYVQISMWQYRYFPAATSKVFERKRGNQLDKANLASLMLKYAGIESDLVYSCSAYGDGYIKEYPTLKQFYTPFLKVRYKGKVSYFNPITSLSNLGDVRSGNRYELNIKTGKIEYIPFESHKERVVVEELKGDLNADGSLYLEINIKYKGGFGASHRQKKFMRKQEIDKKMQKWVTNYHNKARLIAYNFENIDSITEDVNMKVECSIEDYVVRTGDKLYMFKIPMYFGVSHLGQNQRKHDMRFPASISTEDFKFEIKIPEGYRVYYRPTEKNLSLKDYWNISSKSYVKSNVLGLTYSFDQKKTILSKEDYSKNKELKEELSRWTDEYVILEKK